MRATNCNLRHTQGVARDTSSSLPLNQATVSTTCEFFPGGRSLELISSAESDMPQLLFCDGAKQKIGPKIEVDNRIFVPAKISPSLLNATKLPCRRENFGSTVHLFAACCKLFADFGFSDEVARLSTHFALSSWFVESLEILPCLSIIGPRAEAFRFLEVLECVLYRPLRLGELDRGVLGSVPPGWRPTILMDQSARRKPHPLLAVSSQRGSYFQSKSDFVDACFVSAVYHGLSEPEEAALGSIPIFLAPIREKFPVMSAETQRRIADEFQAKLLDYRITNHRAVSSTTYDVPDLSSEIRILTRTLGACVLNAPEIRLRLEQLMRTQDDEARVARWLDVRCVIIEAVLFFCHSQKNRKVYVGKIAEYAGVLSRARGEASELEPRKVGDILRGLRLSTKRDGRGRSLLFNTNICQQVHELARDFQVDASEEFDAQCELCVDVLPRPGTKNVEEPKSGRRK